MAMSAQKYTFFFAIFILYNIQGRFRSVNGGSLIFRKTERSFRNIHSDKYGDPNN